MVLLHFNGWPHTGRSLKGRSDGVGSGDGARRVAGAVRRPRGMGASLGLWASAAARIAPPLADQEQTAAIMVINPDGAGVAARSE